MRARLIRKYFYMLAEVFRGFPQSLQANAGVVPRLGYGRFLFSNIFIIYQPSPYYWTLYILEPWIAAFVI
jgi:hypothetical protein